MTTAYSVPAARTWPFMPQNTLKTALLRLGLCGVLLLAAALTSSCSLFSSEDQGLDSGHSAQAEADTQLSPEAELMYKHLVLNESLSRGDQETALQTAEELLELAPSPELYMQAVMILDQSNLPQEALNTARNGTSRYPDDYNLHILLAELLERQGDVDGTLEVLESFSQRYAVMPADMRRQKMGELTSLREFSTYVMLDNKRIDEASAYLASIPASERSPFLRYYEALILRFNKQDKAARKKLYDLAKEYPEFTDVWLTLAQDMEKAQDYKNAVTFYKKAFESAPNQEIFMQLLRVRIKADDNAGALRQAMESPITAELKLRSAMLFIDHRQYANAKTVLLSIKGEPMVADDVPLYLGIIAYDTGEDIPEAIIGLQEIAPDADNRPRVLNLKAYLYSRVKEYDEAYAAARTLRDEYPENKENWVFLVELGVKVKKYAEMEEVCREALEQWPDDTELMFMLAMNLDFQKKSDEAIPLLEEVLTLESDNALVMNALGYILADSKRDLPRALALIKKAVESRPDEIAFLDSLAWAHYQMGNYKDAWVVIKKCAVNGLSEALIWEHYGDIAQAVGKKKAASMGYQRALELNPDNSTELHKKLELLR